MSRILITGSTGFIGSAVLKQAIAAGHEICVLMRHSGSAPADVHGLIGSMAHPPWEALRAFEPEILIHCAWIATPGVYLESPENWNHAQWSEALAIGLIEQGLQQLVILGTCIEYQLGASRLHEITTPLKPTSTYACAKDYLRQRLMDQLAQHSGVGFAWGRVFYPYGQGEHPARLCSSLAASLQRGEDVVLKTPDSVKDFIYIDDLASAILRVVEARFNGPVNLGTGVGVSIREIANQLGRMLGRADQVRLQAPLIPDPLERVVADVGRLRKLGWEPRVTLDSGLQRLLEKTLL